ncbi:hypothetical protein DI005_01995 [Prauserella sp. PE36]|uniref:Uncharacterized protein n=1 Tax=Prauserella endophytica TaxID=1592324 RepID=A0ABY2SCI0_9PSEU|nr:MULTISPECIES: hypothetical protein [Prauserella]PXY34725.1 hypothetical protein BAY59_04245 [Prauserella coralliicola]RBM23738.1 hypothetical protein DI005_01995 [Prauserella sp. PE36]TKG73256.1 hypothetical protein FCN18_01315 [Prauserella endophytica]
MWVDESGGSDATDTTGTSDEMTITVEGEDYSADVNFDINEDGVEDTAVIEHADGSGQAFVDNDGDGEADEYIALDAQGEVVAHAEYDQASGEWVSIDPGGHGGDSTDTQTGAGGTITADMPEGDVEVGPATVDTNEDGVNDTAVVEDGSGNTIAFTDVDGDGQADVAVVIGPDGESTVLEHTGDGEWTEAGGTAGAAGGSDSLWGGGTDTVEGVAKIDSATGQWISQN